MNKIYSKVAIKDSGQREERIADTYNWEDTDYHVVKHGGTWEINTVKYL